MTTMTTSPFTGFAGESRTTLPATSGLFARVAAWLRTRRNLQELEQLSEAALKDIGLSRADLPRVARYGR
jgi:uncharacterized protein YjiS (DUF1127 family)